MLSGTAPASAMTAHSTEAGAGSAVMIEARSKVGMRAFTAAPQRPVLYEALRAGVALPYECATGTCGTCKARRVSGVILNDWPDAPGAGYLNPAREEVLLCQTRALADCAFEVPGRADFGRSPAIRPRFGQAVVLELRNLTHDVAALRVQMEPALEFEAGQFALLRTPHVKGYRAYSMANHAGKAEEVDFIIKRKLGGGFTEWLFSAAVRGDRLEWFGALGKATFSPREQRTIACIAGGSGIASILSILEAGATARHFEQFAATVFFGVRTRQDVFYLDRLNRLAESSPHTLQITIVFSHDEVDPTLRDRYPKLLFDTGFPHEIAARDLAGRFAGRVAYIAGPPILVDVSIRMLITQARLPARDIRYDKFS